MPEVYPASEDSFLIVKHIPEDLSGKKVLDIGCGSGILAKKALDNGGDVLAIDLNDSALEVTSRLGVKTKKSDLFENVMEKFDLILFNPPYIASDEDDSYLSDEMRMACIDNGAIKRFLRSFKEHLNPGGQVLMIISSNNDVKDEMERDGWKEIDNISFFYEKLFLMKYG